MSTAAPEIIRIADEEEEEEDDDYVPDDEMAGTAEEKEVIAKRTRAQHSLKETAWEELERWLNEQNSPSPPGTPVADETQSLYADFLARLRNPGTAHDDGAETDPGEDDFDFVPQEESEKKRVEEDARIERGTYVSKAEISALLSSDDLPRYRRHGQKRKLPPKPKLLAPKVQAPGAVLPPMSTALTDAQVEQLRSQIGAHVQLLVQTYVLARPQPQYALIAEEQYGMLQTLVHYRNLSDQIYAKSGVIRGPSMRSALRRTTRSRPSVFNTPLLEKLHLLPLPPTLASHSVPPVATAAAPGASVSTSDAKAVPPSATAAKAAPTPSLAEVPATVSLPTEDIDPNVAAAYNKFPLLHQLSKESKKELLLKLPVIQRKTFEVIKKKPTRNTFTATDDENLIKGLQKHGRKNWNQIHSEFLPHRTVAQIINRFRNAVGARAPASALKSWFEDTQKPLSKEEVVTLLRLADEHKMQWDIVSRIAFPSRSTTFLRNVYYTLRPRQPPSAASNSVANAPGMPFPLPLPLSTATLAHEPVVPLPLSTNLGTNVPMPNHDDWEIEELSSSDDDRYHPAKFPRFRTAPETPLPVTPAPLPLPPTPLPLPLSSCTTPRKQNEISPHKEGDFEVEEIDSDDEKADNVLHVNGRRLYWTRDEDREILLASFGRGSFSMGEKWTALASSGKLTDKTASDVEQRYQQLLNLQKRSPFISAKK